MSEVGKMKRVKLGIVIKNIVEELSSFIIERICRWSEFHKDRIKRDRSIFYRSTAHPFILIIDNTIYGAMHPGLKRLCNQRLRVFRQVPTVSEIEDLQQRHHCKRDTSLLRSVQEVVRYSSRVLHLDHIEQKVNNAKRRINLSRLAVAFVTQ